MRIFLRHTAVYQTYDRYHNITCDIQRLQIYLYTIFFSFDSVTFVQRSCSRMGGQFERASRRYRGRRQRSDKVDVVQREFRSRSGARGHCDQRADPDRLEKSNDRVINY